MTGPRAEPDFSRFTVEYDEDEGAYAVGPLGKPDRYLGITLICSDCGIDEGRIAARDRDGDVADLKLINEIARRHWEEHH